MNMAISEYRVHELLAVKDRVHMYHKVALNLNSLLSTMLYKSVDSEMDNSEKDDITKYIKRVQMEIVMFLTEMDKIKKPLICYYSSNRTFTQNDIFPNWYQQMYEKENFTHSYSFYKSFIEVFKKLARTLPMISCVDTGAVDPYLITHLFSGDVLVISRDEMDLLSTAYGHDVFDGKSLLDEEAVAKIYGVPKNLMKYVMVMTGVKKRSYPGIKGFGPKTALKYIINNITSIMEGSDEKYKAVQKYVDFFEPKEYYNKLDAKLKDEIITQIKIL
jgi:5'-3' exonuclease